MSDSRRVVKNIMSIILNKMYPACKKWEDIKNPNLVKSLEDGILVEIEAYGELIADNPNDYYDSSYRCGC